MNTVKLLIANQADIAITYDNGVSTCMSLPNEINITDLRLSLPYSQASENMALYSVIKIQSTALSCKSQFLLFEERDCKYSCPKASSSTPIVFDPIGTESVEVGDHLKHMIVAQSCKVIRSVYTYFYFLDFSLSTRELFYTWQLKEAMRTLWLTLLVKVV